MSDKSVTQTISVRHESNTSDTSATRVLHKRHECNKCATRTTQVKHFDFDNDTCVNIFSHPYISYMANESLQGKKNYLLEMPRSHGKMRLKV